MCQSIGILDEQHFPRWKDLHILPTLRRSLGSSTTYHSTSLYDLCPTTVFTVFPYVLGLKLSTTCSYDPLYSSTWYTCTWVVLLHPLRLVTTTYPILRLSVTPYVAVQDVWHRCRCLVSCQKCTYVTPFLMTMCSDWDPCGCGDRSSRQTWQLTINSRLLLSTTYCGI